MDTHQIIKLLIERKKDYLKTYSFSQLPGIYAFFYIGVDFPLLGNIVKQNGLIYIGKTESSQEKRDAKTHFATGKTGSSTVRKSIGAILNTQIKLNPIPRNSTDYSKGRMSHFKFNLKSEELITEWMENNLALSFFEYPKSKQEIEDLETKIINECIPILNISKNPNNPFKSQLQQLRKNCAITASKSAPIEGNKLVSNISIQSKKKYTTMNSQGKYFNIWVRNRSKIKDKLELASSLQFIQLNLNDFNAVGNRKSYAFNLEFVNGVVSNNIGGSAVARDLAAVLESSQELKYILKGGHYKLQMDKTCGLWIQKI